MTKARYSSRRCRASRRRCSENAATATPMAESRTRLSTWNGSPCIEMDSRSARSCTHARMMLYSADTSTISKPSCKRCAPCAGGVPSSRDSTTVSRESVSMATASSSIRSGIWSLSVGTSRPSAEGSWRTWLRHASSKWCLSRRKAPANRFSSVGVVCIQSQAEGTAQVAQHLYRHGWVRIAEPSEAVHVEHDQLAIGDGSDIGGAWGLHQECRLAEHLPGAQRGKHAALAAG